MRKRNCAKLFDNIFWYTLYLLPVILLIGYYFSIYHDTGAPPDLITVVLSFFGGVDGVLAPSIITNNLIEMLYFFYEGIQVGNGIELFAILCMGYFVLVYLFHLFVDFLLFIPRLAHKWMNDFTQGD